MITPERALREITLAQVANQVLIGILNDLGDVSIVYTDVFAADGAPKHGTRYAGVLADGTRIMHSVSSLGHIPSDMLIQPEEAPEKLRNHIDGAVRDLAGQLKAFASGSPGCEIVTADAWLPIAVEMGARAVDSEGGLSLRLIRNYDIMSDSFMARYDIIFGIRAKTYPQILPAAA